MSQATDAPEVDDVPLTRLATRGATGGLLMGLANLVPGISGGTMLLAAGVYPQFIQAIAEVTTLKFKKTSLTVLGSVVVAAGLAIALLAGPVRDVVVHQRWMAYSVFIGLTLGGVPIVWGLTSKRDGKLWGGALVGFAAMAALAWVQADGGVAAAASTGGFGMMLLAGIAGASAMILPGISGGYLLLVLGVYITILSGIDAVKQGLKAGDFGALVDPIVGVVLPVGIGIVIGVVVVSNVLRWLLRKHEQPTLGALLGLLLGAVVGLWPFQQGVAPALGSTFKGRVVTTEVLADIEPKDFPTEFFDPSLMQGIGAVAFIVLGVLATLLVARVGRAGPRG